jgi:hypothetical protein
MSTKKVKKRLVSNLLFIVALLMFLPSGHAQMSLLCDEELSALYAKGFSNFSITNGEVKIELNINFSTYTQIDSLKLGYHDEHFRIAGNKNLGNAWDEDWTDVSIGTSGEDLVANGLILQAKFSNIDDPANRTLDWVRLTIPNMEGSIFADFNSFTGTVGGVDYCRDNLGTMELTSSNPSEFYIELSNIWKVYSYPPPRNDEQHRGFDIVWTGATFQ